MKRSVRIGLVALGAAVAVYAAASLTGGWLGTPPWWERVHTLDISVRLRETTGLRAATPPERVKLRVVEDLDGRERVSVVVLGVGLALAARGAWPARPRHPGSAAAPGAEAPETSSAAT